MTPANDRMKAGQIALLDFQAVSAYLSFSEAFAAGHIGGVPLGFYLAAALAGEAGELMNKIKKEFRDGRSPERHGEILDEMGDVLCYLAVLCESRGTSLEYIAERNRAKLRARRQEASR